MQLQMPNSYHEELTPAMMGAVQVSDGLEKNRLQLEVSHPTYNTQYGPLPFLKRQGVEYHVVL
jgi:hypothetical protein